MCAEHDHHGVKVLPYVPPSTLLHFIIYVSTLPSIPPDLDIRANAYDAVTEWRQTPDYQGGFVLDGGIHVVAGLRLILSGAEDALATLSAQACLQQAHLAPVDTVDAVVKTRGGATGAVSLSYGSPFRDSVFEFGCADGGVVTLDGDRVTVDGESYEVPFQGRCVKEEIAEFGAAVVGARGVPERLRPREAMADLEVVERMLESSGRDGERVKLELQ